MVDNSGQLYTIEGIAAGILMLTTAYLVLSTTSIYTPAETHISDMQLEQLGNDVLSVMGTPHTSEFTYAQGENKSELAQYIEKNQQIEFAIRFNDLATRKGAENIKFNATIYYRNATGSIQPYSFSSTSNSGATWVQMNSSESWPPRDSFSSVAMPDSSIVLMGGYNGTIYLSDVWRSYDQGVSWSLMTAGAGWTPRANFSSVAMPDGSIILMGGNNATSYFGDVWRSTDKGATWKRLTANAGWTPRSSFSTIVTQNGSIILMGGNDGSLKNDVWKSTNNGATWTQLTANAAWSPRASFSSTTLPDTTIVLMGGNDGSRKNDVWKSLDYGSSWTNVAGSSSWTPRASFSSVAMPDNSIILMGGNDGSLKNDVYRSTDEGLTWTSLTAGAGWTPRSSFSSVMVSMPSGNVNLIILMGGLGASGPLNDVWSSISKPIITNRERMVTVSRLVQLDPTKFTLGLPFDNRPQTVLMEVSLWRA